MGAKNLKFYNFLITKNLESKSKREILNELETKRVLKEFMEQHTTRNSFGVKCTQFLTQSSIVYFDVIEDNDDYLFATIGKQAQAKLQIRDIDELNSKRIDKQENEIFEAFTYFILDYKRLIITYVSNQHSPSIYNLTYLFNRVDIENGTRVDGFSEYDIHPQMIIEENALKSVLKQDQLQDFTYEIATPQPDVLGNIIHDKKLYEKLVKDGIEVSTQIIVKRKKEKGKLTKALGSVKDYSELLTEMARNIQGSSETENKSLKFRTKNDGELLQTFDLLDNKYTYKASWNIDEDKIIQTLKAQYDPNTESLEKIFFDQINRFILKQLLDGYNKNIERLLDLTRKVNS